jgi:hypothetical protein
MHQRAITPASRERKACATAAADARISVAVVSQPMQGSVTEQP